MPNYFSTLGVSPDASQDEIKKMYRKRALEHHPDRGGDKEKFQEIQEAYEQIMNGNGDGSKSQQQNPFQHHHQGGFPGNDFFQNIFSSMNFSFQQRQQGGGSGGTTHHHQSKQIRLDITFEEAFNGCTKTVKDTSTEMCSCCEKCTHCNGNGFMIMRQFNLQIQVPCNMCQTQGHKSSKQNCTDCKGSRYISKEKTFSIPIKAGASDNSIITIQTFEHSSLNIALHVQPSEKFQRKGHDLVYRFQLDWLDAITGSMIYIAHPKGEIISIDSVSLGPIQNNKEYIIPNEGFVYDSVHKGNLILVCELQNIPTTLSEQFRVALKDLYQKEKSTTV